MLDAGLVRIGFGHSQDRLNRDAQTYWADGNGDGWEANSHWRGMGDTWQQMGPAHLELYQRLVGVPAPKARKIVDWGCGGGANAVSFAPLAGEYVGADIALATLERCRNEVAAVCATPFTAVTIDVTQPETAAAGIGSCDLFLCLYVLELAPTPEYGLRLMRIAYDMLEPGGLAFVQFKYDVGSWRTRSRRRGYRESTAASMTTYRIDEFWTACEALGFKPETMALVPQNDLDERYAYALLSKPEGTEFHDDQRQSPGTEEG